MTNKAGSKWSDLIGMTSPLAGTLRQAECLGCLRDSSSGIVSNILFRVWLARMALLIGGIALSLTYGKQFTTSSLSLGEGPKKDCYVHTKQAFLPVHISKGVLGTAFHLCFVHICSFQDRLSLNQCIHASRKSSKK